MAWIIAAAFFFQIMSLMWWVQKQRRNANHVDFVWAVGVGVIAIYWALLGDGDVFRRVMVALLALIWSGRLGYYLWTDRVWKVSVEDSRYRFFREKWSQSQFYIFFQAQALFVLLFGLPFFVVSQNTESLWGWHDSLAVLIFLIAVVGESIADRQLANFKSKPENKGKVCQVGLWKYSRHPNYFFECLHWLTYVFLSIGYAGWWISLIGPVAMVFFIYRVTGIPYTEMQSLKSRGEAYRRYQRTTSPLVPWFPKKEVQ